MHHDAATDATHTTAAPKRRLRKGFVAGIALAGVLVLSVGSASAAPTTVYTPGSHGKTSANWDTYRQKASGTADDITANDSRCTYVYGQGKNSILGWGGWNQRARACAGGTDGWSETPAVYGDGYRISVCNGPASNPGSAANCTRKTLFG